VFELPFQAVRLRLIDQFGDCRSGAYREAWEIDAKRKDVKSGPFSKAEDELLLEAVREYGRQHNLPLDDLSWAGDFTKMKKATNQKHKSTAIAEVRGFRLCSLRLCAIVSHALVCCGCPETFKTSSFLAWWALLIVCAVV
jgi:hypothetical protein